jgi:hypothetical protein
MDDQSEQSDSDRLDRATAARLARLRSMPMDVSGLERRLRAEVGTATAEPSRRMWIARPVRTAIAAVLVLGLIGVVAFVLLGQPAVASAAQMAQVHEDLVSGRTPIMKVESIEEAGRVLARDWPQSPDLPGVPSEHVMACCMKSVRNKKMACVLLKAEGAPVTMAVANAADMRLPSSPTRVRAGVTYHVQSSGRVNMVMTERQGRWVCLMGEAPIERLMDFAERLQF